ncbi:MAG: hypothetical protein JW704_01070, partial [Anaerolineaceae bacterium]|nr:hypothetical protein [Anaerolineaceae bacterium]
MSKKAIIRRIFNPIMILIVLAGLFVFPSQSAQALSLSDLTLTPLTWNVIGLDSNNVNAGPNNFPVGARLCNANLTDTAEDVQPYFNWDTNPAYVSDYINLREDSYGTPGGGEYPALDLAPNTCVDIYYEIEIERNTLAYDESSHYAITAQIPGYGTVSTPNPRELYVERIVSQSRNATLDVLLEGVSIPPGGSMYLSVGQTYTITLIASTATNGYEQIESYINFPNTIFRIIEVDTTYNANDLFSPDPLAGSRLYADGCSWQNDPTLPTYQSCLGTGKYGGTVTVTYEVEIIAGAGTTQSLNSLIYDFSGSSYHYNADFSMAGRIATIIDPLDIAITKEFVPSVINPGGTSELTIRLTNPNGAVIDNVEFSDNLPDDIVRTGGAAVLTNCGIYATLTGTDPIYFNDGTLAANSTCVIKVPVSSSVVGDYHNFTSNVFVDGVDTGKSDDAWLHVVDTYMPMCVGGQTMVVWTVPPGSSNPPDSGGSPTTPGNPTINNTGYPATASIQRIAASAISTSGHNDTASWNTYGYRTGNYVEFTINTRYYEDVVMDFWWDNSTPSNGPKTVTVSYDAGSGFVDLPPGTLTVPGSGGWIQAAIDLTGLTNTTGPTTIRIASNDANNDGQNSGFRYDDITFTVCRYPAPPPAITKDFQQDPIGTGDTSTLRFTITNTKEYNQNLTGITFTDVLPVGLTLTGSPPVTPCGGTVTYPDSRTILLQNGVLAAGGSCSFDVTVLGSAPGYYDNVSEPISSTESGPNTGPDGIAADTLTVISPPHISKSFSDTPIMVGDTTLLSFTISNPNPAVTLTQITFTDSLPAEATVATSSVSACNGGTLTMVYPSSISLMGGTLSPNTSCTFSVTVTGASPGTVHNVTS